MCKALSVLLACLLVPAEVISQSAAEPTLKVGIQQVDEGDFQAALVTLDSVIQRLTPEADAHRPELTQAHLYQGVALVGLGQEERAKAAFREALGLDPALRVAKGQFPDRVVRVFDAARTGKSKSVMQRPKPTAKRAGIGALGIAAIVGGAVAAGGAAVVASGGGSNEPAPAPTRSISFLGSTPSAGATISVGPTGQRRTPVSLATSFSLLWDQNTTAQLWVLLFKGQTPTCAFVESQTLTLSAGTAQTVNVPSIDLLFPENPACQPPVTTTRVVAQVFVPAGGPIALTGDFNTSYTFVP